MRDLVIVLLGFALGQAVRLAWHRLRRHVIGLALAVAMGVALGGCATRTVAVMQPRAALPADMTSCPDLPDLRRARTDADVAHGILALSATAKECHSHLAATRDALDAEH